MGPHLAVVFVLADEVRFSKGLFEVSPAGLRLATNVPIGFVYPGVVGVDFRGIRFHGLFRVKDCGEQFVFHLDERQGLLGRILVYGGHPGQVLPDMTDPIDGDRILVRRIAGCLHKPVLDLKRIRRRDYRLDTRQFFRLTRVDAQNSRMGMRASQNLSDEHSREG